MEIVIENPALRHCEAAPKTFNEQCPFTPLRKVFFRCANSLTLRADE